MDEHTWNTSEDPRAMLEWLSQQGRLSDRKARLFAVACCRRIWPQSNDKRCQHAVEVAERFADNDATRSELVSAAHAAWLACSSIENFNARDAAWDCCGDMEKVLDACEAAAHDAAWMLGSERERLEGTYLNGPAGASAYREEHVAQTDLLCDLFSPFVAVRGDTGWRTPAVASLARQIYDNRVFDAMPALGAALSDGGCTEPETLRHCSRGPHVRGCVLLDAILGRSP